MLKLLFTSPLCALALFTPPAPLSIWEPTATFGTLPGAQFVDLNGDGLPDLSYWVDDHIDKPPGKMYTYLNNGCQFVEASTLSKLQYCSTHLAKTRFLVRVPGKSSLLSGFHVSLAATFNKTKNHVSKLVGFEVESLRNAKTHAVISDLADIRAGDIVLARNAEQERSLHTPQDAHACHCVLPTPGGYINCCQNLDLNGDQVMDILVSCQLQPSSVFPYGELINTYDSFCVRYSNSDFANVCGGFPPC